MRWAKGAYLRSVSRAFRANPAAVAGLVVFGALVVCAVCAPLLAPYDPAASDLSLRLRGIGTPGHPLGLDGNGRDMLSRLIYGARVSLLTGLVPVAAGGIAAVPIGLLAGYYERAGTVVMRVMDVLFAFPIVLLGILLAAILGPGLPNLLAALTVVVIPYTARVVFVETVLSKHLGFVEAARALGASDRRIIAGQLLPQVLSAAVVYSMTIVGAISIAAAGLSFLGLGIQPPTADWGLMTSDGRNVLNLAPHVSTLPGVAICVMVISLNMMGDGVRAALDPLLRANAALEGRR
ncbi:MAG TPA: ABC transporter permease [Candidatus Elarobacter sp.]|jgi:peptide/nickel transport system permease protein|nr:ABC transporter permease [Candidatus Elarobacter sp.]